MNSLFDRLQFGKGNSADQAKERLKLVLIHDRAELTPQALNDMKNEILEVISKYIEIDPTAVAIHMAQEGREQRLIADIPIKANKHRKIG
jgi:cell division topological specificity factor